MRKSNIENWVLNIAERVENNQPIEDFRIEVKSVWPKDYYKTARQIAAHANSARGESILWIIGLDEKIGFVGVSPQELSSWWPQIYCMFDENIYPNLIDLNIPYKDKILVALFFETDRAPFVVKNQEGKIPHTEVPWREGTSTRSAHRSDLIKILVPYQELPVFDLLEGELNLVDSLKKEESHYSFDLNFEYYVTKLTNALNVIPYHKCNIEINWDGQNAFPSLERIKLTPPLKPHHIGVNLADRLRRPDVDSLTMDYTNSEVLISGPGILYLKANLSIQKKPITIPETINVKINLNPINMDIGFKEIYSLKRISSDEGQPIVASWKLSAV
jgi:hypothetical protein